MIREIASITNYRGYTIETQKDSDGFYWIIYNPPLDKDLDSRYNKGMREGQAIQNAKRGIDEQLKRK